MLEKTVTEQLFKMLARQLDNSPAADDLPQVIEVMVDDLRRAGLTDDDSDRLVQAFDRIAITGIRWPTAVAVKDALPRKVHSHYPRLPYKRTEDQKAKARAHLGKIKNMLTGDRG